MQSRTLEINTRKFKLNISIEESFKKEKNKKNAYLAKDIKLCHLLLAVYFLPWIASGLAQHK